MNNSGVYQIRNIVNDKRYVGSSSNIKNGTFEELFQEEYIREGVGRISRRGTPKIGEAVH